MLEYISALDRQCKVNFAQLVEAVCVHQNQLTDYVRLSDVVDEFDRYKVWAANVGAGHSGKSYTKSLDYRLREAKYYKQKILKVLSRVEELVRLSTCASLQSLEINKSTIPTKYADDVIKLVKAHQVLTRDAESTYEDEMVENVGDHREPTDDFDSNWAISDSDEETLAEVSCDTEARVSSASASTGLRNTVSRLIAPVGASSLAALPEFASLFQSLKFTITCLYKMPVRSVAMTSRLERLKHGMDDSILPYQHFDILYVQDLFPSLDMRVQNRLGRLITRRRQLLRYRKLHNENLQRESFESDAAGFGLTTKVTESVIVPTSSKDVPMDGEKSDAASKPLGTSTRASTFDPKKDSKLTTDFPFRGTVSEADTMSSVATARTGQELLPVPPRPRNTENEELECFECPYCCLVVHVRLSAHAWKKHVLEDLEPYVCTFPECEKHDSTFANREEWFEHESQHRLNYHCGERDHEHFVDEAHFLRHMACKHSLPVEPTWNSATLSIFLQLTDLNSAVTCPLCGHTTSRLKSHLSRHLERIALFSIPKTHELEELEASGLQDSELSIGLLNGSGIHRFKSSSKALESIPDSGILSLESVYGRDQEADIFDESEGQLETSQEDDFGGAAVTVPDTGNVSWSHIKPELRAASPPLSNSPPPVYIAVMGESGVGKTTFINEATGEELVIRHNLDRGTQDIEEVETTIDGRTIKLIDTPGFNDSFRSDSDILEIIGAYLRTAYAERIFLTGIIYLQRIHENRMQGSAIRSLRLLRNLCGPENYGNIVLVTLGWSNPPRNEEERRETQLRTTDTFWGEFIKQGATIQRHHGGKESSIRIIKHLLDKTPLVLKFQRELAKVGIIGRTSAGEEAILNLAKDKEAAQTND